MRNLEPVGLSEDGDHLVLVSDTGERFAVPADGRLRAALRGDRPRLGQLEIQMNSALRPRDIQSRIRAGETPEAVAQLAGVEVDKIIGYAVPVMAERSHVVERAQRSAVRRKRGDGPGRLLGDAVAERLRGRSVDPASARWDAWRREDGRWNVQISYLSGERERVGNFQYDSAGRFVLPDDEESRWLVGDQSTAKGPQPREAGQSRRLSAVPDEEDLLSLDDGEPTIDLSADLDGQPPPAEPDDMSALADAIREPAAAVDDGIAEQRSVAGETAGGSPVARGSTKPERRSGRKTRRTVPSWDEIMFGKQE